MRATGNSPIFQIPRRRASGARLWVTASLCALLPPVGLVLLWRRLRCPMRGKMLLSAVALVSMTLILSAYIARRQQSEIYVPQQAAQQLIIDDYTAQDAATAAPQAPSQTAALAQPDATPAPANPAG